MSPLRHQRRFERRRMGVYERSRQAVNALYLLGWEIGLELADAEAEAKAGDRDMAKYLLDRAELEVDEYSRVGELLTSIRKAIAEARGGAGLQAKLAALRDTSGRTPEEAAAYRAKADELEGR